MESSYDARRESWKTFFHGTTNAPARFWTACRSAGLECKDAVEIDADKAHRLRDDYRNAIIYLLEPDVFPVEFAHAATRAERANRVTPDQGLRSIGAMMSTLPVLHPSITLIPRAYELSSQFRIGVYGCLYVALAEQEQCELITADQRVVNVAPVSRTSVSSIVVWQTRVLYDRIDQIGQSQGGRRETSITFPVSSNPAVAFAPPTQS